MALRAMYKGIKKVLAPLIINRPGELAIDQDALNSELNTVFFPRSEQAVLGAYNRMEFPYYQVAPTFTKDGVTFTTDDNGIITGDSSGVAATGNAEVNIHGRLAGDTYVPMYLPIGKYKVGIGCSDSQIGIQFATTYNSGWSALTDIVYGNNWLDFEITADTHSDIKLSDGSVLVAVYIRSSNTTKVWNNIKIYPMIYSQGTPDNFPFVPFAMLNKELTDAVATLNGSASDQKTTINAIITAATGAADFAAFKTAMGAITPVTRSIQITPETKDEITEPVEEVKKTTRKKSTAKAETEKEGE